MANETILVADDDGIVVEFLSLWLREEGFNVTTAADCMQVTMSVRRSPPRAVVLNLTMPGGTGFDVLHRLGANAATKRVPIVAISANVDPDLPRKAVENGARVFLYKPVERDELVAAVRGVLA
jgi:DNA-binding response OmpR family regulator